MMKKVMFIILLAVMLLGLAACSGPKDIQLTGELEEIMEKIYAESKLEFPTMHITEVTEENEEYFLGINGLKYEEAIASEPMMSSQAHSLVLIRVSEETDVEKLKADIKDNVDGRKWICVGVEEQDIITDHIGNLVILIMDDQAKAIQESFLNLKDK